MITVTVSPKDAGPIKQDDIQPAHYVLKTQKFTATVTGDPANAGVTWEVAQSGGTINELGVFTPPVQHGGRPGQNKSIVRATSVTDKSKYDEAGVTY